MIPRVKGTHDHLDMRLHDAVYERIVKQLHCYNFVHITTPILELLELFKRSLGLHTDVVTKEMFVIESGPQQTERICLRPEMTAGVMRAFLENAAQQTPWKIFSQGPVFRHERPQKGRFRQFLQCSIEVIAAPSIMHDVELITLLDRLFDRQLNLDSYALLINFLGCAQDRAEYAQRLKDFLATVPEGALCEQCMIRKEKNLLRIFDCKNACQQVYVSAPRVTDYLCTACQTEWQHLKDTLHMMGVTYQHDPHLVRGLDYYSKTVFEFVSETLGAQRTFCAGGRYDGLAQQLGAREPVPAIGAAIGIERLLLLLEGPKGEALLPSAPPLAVIMPLSSAQEQLALLLADMLRIAGVATDVLSDSASLKSMMRTANKMAATWALLLGDDEQQTQTVTIKWMNKARQERVLQADVLGYLQQD
jgi:histidyl-tRNA synthetase